jgi:hypothetical protein
LYRRASNSGRDVGGKDVDDDEDGSDDNEDGDGNDDGKGSGSGSFMLLLSPGLFICSLRSALTQHT